ncbi:MAG: tryptophan synthase subunit alpha [Vulcanimicrobiaceae bacterium]
MLTALFERARTERRSALIPYVMAGDPDLSTCELVLHALGRAGADAIELGIPYGDPLADGPTIAAAGQRALVNDIGIAEVLDLVRRYRDAGGVPVVLFTYFNPVYQYGLERFARDVARAGGCGAIVPDIALEESSQLAATLAQHGLDMPLLVAPSTSPDRAKIIAAQATGFVYVVSRMGVTGANTAPNFDPLRLQLAMLRGITDKPLAVGFGVSHPGHVREVGPLADGIIVGSALIEAYRGTQGQEAASRVGAFVASLREAAARLA